MTIIRVNEPAGGRARFRHRTPSEALAHYTLESIPGSIDLPPVPESDYYQVTLRREQGDGGQWAETFAIRPPASGTHALEDLDRLPLGEAAAGGFALESRVANLENTLGEHQLALGVVEDRLDSLDQELGRRTGRIEISARFPGVSIGGGGGLFIERRGSTVIFSVAAVDFGGQNFTGGIPPGFRPTTFIYEAMAEGSSGATVRVDVLASGNVRTYGSGTLRGAMVWMTDEPWPT